MHMDSGQGTLAPTDLKELDAVVVGAGIAGLYQLHTLRRRGFKVTVLEAGDDVGGTWYWNRYPGARCDVESMSYSYSFSPELEQEWAWTDRYAKQPEILSYIRHVADRFDLRSDIKFSTRVASASYDEDGDRWTVTTEHGDIYTAQFLIMATGCLSAAKDPEIPGLDSFRGATYHTGRWPHTEVDFAGQRVAVIGTGSSGIQAIPEIAAQAAHLTVFQRTPNFSIGARHRRLTADEVADRKKNYGAWREAQKHSFFGVPEQPPTRSALEVSPEERTATYEAGWQSGRLNGLLATYTDILTDKAANDTAAEFIRGKIHDTVDDPDVAEILSPRTFPYGTKRPCLDDNYYATFNRDNVRLVDLRKTPLVEATADGLRTSTEAFAFDSLVFATGFDALTGALTAVDIRGRAGLSLDEKWAAGPRTYLGLMTAGFPNLFTITGPLSPSVLSNMMLSIEQHVDWVTDCIESLRDASDSVIEATPEAEDAWTEHVADVAASTLVTSADSYYMGSNVPGKARVFMAYIGGFAAYSGKLADVVEHDYEGFIRSRAPIGQAVARS